MKDDFRIKLQQRIDWSELDLFGHVNNVMFLKYAQTARVNYWEQIKLYQHFLSTKQGPMLASVTCQFRKPLFYPGNITIYTKMKAIGNTSFCMLHHIIDDNNKLVAEVEDVIVMYDFYKEEKMFFNEFFRKNVEALEGRKF